MYIIQYLIKQQNPDRLGKTNHIYIEDILWFKFEDVSISQMRQDFIYFHECKAQIVPYLR